MYYEQMVEMSCLPKNHWKGGKALIMLKVVVVIIMIIINQTF